MHHTGTIVHYWQGGSRFNRTSASLLVQKTLELESWKFEKRNASCLTKNMVRVQKRLTLIVLVIISIPIINSICVLFKPRCLPLKRGRKQGPAITWLFAQLHWSALLTTMCYACWETASSSILNTLPLQNRSKDPSHRCTRNSHQSPSTSFVGK